MNNNKNASPLSVRHPFRDALYRQEAASAVALHRPQRSDLAFFTISFVSFFIIIMGMTS